jgi:hypothetical protein
MKDNRVFIDTNIFIYAILKENRTGDKGEGLELYFKAFGSLVARQL